MELVSEEVNDSVTLFNLKLSEGELVLYLDCLNYMIGNSDDNKVSLLTECSSVEELSWYRDDINSLLKNMKKKDFLPDRYR
ncbi:hypothetical protein [Pseudomonas nitroreducens]|uniref:hypothetical protein n=1 Tax=Pseudomonas nitroreducens TaxID=46680 RepID=UPI003816167F